MSAAAKACGALTLAALFALANQAHGAELALPRDGWVSWDVPAVDGAPAWCCYGGRKGREGDREACALDDRANSLGSRGDGETMTTARVYARSTAGKVDRVQVLSPACPVVTRTPVRELTGVTVDDSARWLAARLDESSPGTERHEHLMPALAMHHGDIARDALTRLARSHARFDTRKSAVFWLSQVRGAEGADITSSLMFGDANPKMREHAAFALSQSDSPRVSADLIRLGNTDKVGDVRSKAWFWLAETGAPDAERAINEAVRRDPDRDVREEAIFALSLLPDERATRALIAAAEDQSLSREQRKRAVFWLSQSRSDAAVAYLDRVLAKGLP